MTSSADLFFRISGKKHKDTLLFLHGFMGSIADWDDIIADLKRDFRCLAVDLPGHGKTSTKNKDAYGMERTASAIISLLDSLGIDKCGIIAYSMGGRIAYYLLTHYPGRFTKSVIESASPGIADPAERKARKLQDKILSERLAKAGKDDFRILLHEWYTSGVFKGTKPDTARFKELMRTRMKNDPGRLALSLRGNGIGSQASLWPEIRKISADLLLLAGEKDSKFRNINKLVTLILHQSPCKINFARQPGRLPTQRREILSLNWMVKLKTNVVKPRLSPWGRTHHGPEGEHCSPGVQCSGVKQRNPSIRDGVIKSAGHNIHFDKPNEYLKAVRKFLER